jgi:hypothetical protein
MKKYFLSMMSVMMMALACVCLSACGDDDKDDGGSGSGSSSSISGDGENYEFDYGYWYAHEMGGEEAEYIIQLFNCPYYKAIEKQDASLLPSTLKTINIMFHAEKKATGVPTGDFAPYEVLLASVSKEEMMQGEQHGKQYTAFSDSIPVNITKSGDKYTISFGALDFYEMFGGDRENASFTSKPFTFTGTLSQVPEKYFQYE